MSPPLNTECLTAFLFKIIDDFAIWQIHAYKFLGYSQLLSYAADILVFLVQYTYFPASFRCPATSADEYLPYLTSAHLYIYFRKLPLDRCKALMIGLLSRMPVSTARTGVFLPVIVVRTIING